MVEVIAIEFEGLSAIPAGGAPARDRRPFCVVAARGHGDMETFTRRPPETPKIAVLSNGEVSTLDPYVALRDDPHLYRRQAPA